MRLLGEAVRIGSVPFTIIGVLEKKGLGAAGRSQDDVVRIPTKTPGYNGIMPPGTPAVGAARRRGNRIVLPFAAVQIVCKWP